MWSAKNFFFGAVCILVFSVHFAVMNLTKARGHTVTLRSVTKAHLLNVNMYVKLKIREQILAIMTIKSGDHPRCSSATNLNKIVMVEGPRCRDINVNPY